MSDLLFEVENLENRQLMAGDVSVALTNGGDLVVRGDNAANEIVITSSPDSDAFWVEGIDGTTINGRSQRMLFDGVTDDIRINLRNGDNKLLLTHDGDNGVNPFHIADRLEIRTGNGNDAVILNLDQANGQVRISSGAGNDTVGILESALRDRLAINTASGNDTVTVQESLVDGPAEVRTGSGDDFAISYDTIWKDRVRVNTQSGNDNIAMLMGEFEDQSTLNAGSGVDLLWWSTAGNATSYADNEQIGIEVFTGVENLDDLERMDNAIKATNPHFEAARAFTYDNSNL